MGISLNIVDSEGNEFPSNRFKGNLVGIYDIYQYLIELPLNEVDIIHLEENRLYRPRNLDKFNGYLSTIRYNRNLWAVLYAILCEQNTKWYLEFNQ